MSTSEPAEKTGLRNAWGRVAERYDALWTARTAVYTELGLDLLGPAVDGAGLDVACGPGATAAALADRLADGTTLGVDFAPAMVDRARARYADRPGLTFAEGDAERLDLPDAAFDAITCSFGLMYCYGARAALTEMARVLRPGGRMAQVVWGRAADVWWSPVIELIETRAAYFSAVCPMMFFYGLPGVLARMMEEVGLEVVAEQRSAEPMRFASPGDAAEAAIHGGPLAGLFANRLSTDQQEEVRAALTAHVAARAQPAPEGVALSADVAVVVARRP